MSFAPKATIMDARDVSRALGRISHEIVERNHEALKWVEEFSAFDEPYVHHRFGDDIKVLMVREAVLGAAKATDTKQGRARHG